MLRESIESIPVFKDLIDLHRHHSLDEPVSGILGGAPADYSKFKEIVVDESSRPSPPPCEEIVDLRKDHLQSMPTCSE